MADLVPDFEALVEQELAKMPRRKPVTVVEDDISTGEALRRKLWIDTYTGLMAHTSFGETDCGKFADKAVQKYDKWLADQIVEETRAF